MQAENVIILRRHLTVNMVKVSQKSPKILAFTAWWISVSKWMFQPKCLPWFKNSNLPNWITLGVQILTQKPKGAGNKCNISVYYQTLGRAVGAQYWFSNKKQSKRWDFALLVIESVPHTNFVTTKALKSV